MCVADKTDLEEVKQRLEDLEAESREVSRELSAQLIRQEHRIVPCLINFWRYVLPGREREGNRKQELAARSALFWRVASPGSVAVAGGTLVAVVGLWYAAGANRLIDSQNELIRTQNFLVESSRRSTLVFELSSILDEIDEELDEQEERGVPTTEERHPMKALLESIPSTVTGDKSKCECRELSERLSGRIVAVSQALLPYRYQEDDGELSALTSPEQGQLLVSLVRSNVCIPSGTNFRHAQVRDTDLSSARLCWTDLSDANLSGAYMSHSSMVSVSLARANLSGIRLNRSILVGAAVTDANAKEADIKEADLSFASIWSTSLEGANLVGSHFQGGHLLRVDFRNAKLDGANFTGATIWECDFSGASLDGANFSWTDLRKSTLDTVGDLGEISSIQGANVYGLEITAPEIFEWAIANGAVSVADEQEWYALRKESLANNELVGYEHFGDPPGSNSSDEPSP